MSPELLIALGGLVLGVLVGRRWSLIALGAALAGLAGMQIEIDGADWWLLGVLTAGLFAVSATVGAILRTKLPGEWRRR